MASSSSRIAASGPAAVPLRAAKGPWVVHGTARPCALDAAPAIGVIDAEFV